MNMKIGNLVRLVGSIHEDAVGIVVKVKIRNSPRSLIFWLDIKSSTEEHNSVLEIISESR